MGYLSPQIEAWSKRNRHSNTTLIKKEVSCGIFQDYGKDETQGLENRAE
ncbi:MAG: hypothetical protein MUO53_02725 [Maribacter sp.]|nr:hypothetical protein [Maribacter sp.]